MSQFSDCRTSDSVIPAFIIQDFYNSGWRGHRKRREKKGGEGTEEVSIGSVRLSMKVSTSASIIFAGVERSGLVRV